jgi:hypothetical protein
MFLFHLTETPTLQCHACCDSLVIDMWATLDFFTFTAYSRWGKRENGYMLLPMILVRNHIRNMLGGERGKITFRRLSINLGRRAKRIPSWYNILVHWEDAEGGCCCKMYDSVCHAEGFGLLLAKGCTVSPLWPPANKNILWSFRHTSIRHLFMLDQGCGLEASPRWFRRRFLAETGATKLKRNTWTIKKEVYFCLWNF